MPLSKFHTKKVPRLSRLGNSGIEAILEIKLSSSAGNNDRDNIQAALEDLNKFLGMKMKFTVSSGGGGGEPFLERSSCPMVHRKGDNK